MKSQSRTHALFSNVGGTDAGSFRLRLDRSVPEFPDLSWDMSGLAPGDAITRTFFCYAGRQTATADPAGQVAESDETNNSREDTLRCIE
jgi:CARDB